MGKDPAFLFYSKDWLEGTAEMMPQEKGIYIDLLCHQHQRGSIPNDPIRLATMVGLPYSKFKKAWALLKAKFVLSEDGSLTNEKLISVGNNRKTHSKMRKILGTFGGILRAVDASELVKERVRKGFDYLEFIDIDDNLLSVEISKWLVISLANSLPKANQTLGNGIGTEDGIILIEERFKKFWERYPKKKSKGDAEKAWNRIAPTQTLFEKIMQSVESERQTEQWAKNNGQFIPYPATWLNAKGWENETAQELQQEKETIKNTIRGDAN